VRGVLGAVLNVPQICVDYTTVSKPRHTNGGRFGVVRDGWIAGGMERDALSPRRIQP